MMRRVLGILVLTGTSLLLGTPARGASEIVIAIRYLQAEGTSHSHLFLYREDGKLLRQLTNDDSGQDSAPIFAPDGASIIFTREKPGGAGEFWSIDPLGKGLKKLEAAQIGMALRKARHILQMSSPRNRHLRTQQFHLRNPHPPPQRRYPRTNHPMVLSN
jgi:hypothetical protein